MSDQKTIYAGFFKQPVAEFFTAEKAPAAAATACAFCGSDVFVATAAGLYKKDGDAFAPTELRTPVNALFTDRNGLLWIATQNKAVACCADGKNVCEQVFGSEVRAFAEDEKRLWILTEKELFRYEDGVFTRHCGVEGHNGKYIAAFADGGVFVYNGELLLGLHGKRPRWGGIFPALSDMPTDKITALASDSWGHLFIGTPDGLVLYDGKSAWYTNREIRDLTDKSVTAIALSADGNRYIGTRDGLLLQRGVRRRFYTKGRWLPSNCVTAVTVHPTQDEIWVCTDEGISRIRFIDMTLAEKAEHFQNIAEKYHTREDYFSYRVLSQPGVIESGNVEISDNDGLWTGSFLAALSCKYAVTKDAHTLEVARKAMKALLRLFTVTGIPGFPARAYRRPGEDRYGNGNPEWHLTEDENGALEWKGETSSDETTGHYFGLTYYYDLCADAEEKKEIADTLCACTDHILQNGYTLCDTDGQPTTWAHWGPHELNRVDFWRWERGCNSMELLCMLRSAYHVSGDEKYIREYRRLIQEEHYALNCTQHKMEDAHENHIDDNLGFLTAATLLRYEDDPHLRALYLGGLLHHWQYERIERCGFWSFIFGHYAQGEYCDLDNAVQYLKDLPMSFINYPICNSHRKELQWDEGPLAFGGRVQLAEPLPYDEGNVTNFDGNPFFADGGNAMHCQLPTVFLLPYWYGRWCGLLSE